MSGAAERTRTFTWSDPMIGAKAALTMSGLDYLRGMGKGDFPPPPIVDLVDFRFLNVEEGRIVFGFTPAEYHYNPIGSVHGGVISTLLDSALSCAVHSTLPAGTGYTTLEIKVNYVRAVTAKTGPMRCEGKVIHRGSNVATSGAFLTDAEGKLYAHASGTCMIFKIANISKSEG
jgi:uncharacterized protein (TIGR00369 family)